MLEKQTQLQQCGECDQKEILRLLGGDYAT